MPILILLDGEFNMAFYLIMHDGGVYANSDLYIAAIAGGEKAFMKMLANKTAVGKKLFDQTLYSLAEEQEKKCAGYSPIVQDFEDFYKHLNVISGRVLEQVKQDGHPSLPNAALITVKPEIISEKYKYRQATFFGVKDFKENRKYQMLAKMAAVKVCGFWYVALNAVDVRIESPIIVTLKN